jgi:phosphoesterase RecJ-like protein
MTTSELKKAKRQILAKIKESDNFAILISDPDPDAVGSGLAMKKILDQMGKKSKLYSSYEIKKDYHYFPGIEEYIITDISELDLGQFNCLIFLDSAHKARVLDSNRQTEEFNLPKDVIIINIDHHPSNPLFGTINYCSEHISSAAEAVYMIFKDKIEISSNIATNILAGIIGDTGCFKFAVSYQIFNIASQLVQKGADHAYIIRNMFYSYPKNIILMNMDAIKNIKFVEAGKYEFIYTIMDGRKFGIEDIQRDQRWIVQEGVLKTLKDSSFSLVITPVDRNLTKMSFRSERYDVNKLAKEFEGGGHAKAAGATVKMPPEDIVAKLKELLKANKLKPLKKQVNG